MKTDDLKAKGLTDEQVAFVMAENGKDLKKLQKEADALTADRDAWKEKAEAAETALQNFDGIDPAKIQAELESWKQKAADAEKSAQAKLYERDFSDALKAELDAVKFSSEAAKRDVTAQIKAAELKLKDGKILGLSDLLGQIKKADASAFVDEQQERLEAGKARFTQPQKTGVGTNSLTKTDILNIRDTTERQNAIAANIDLFRKE